MKITLKNVSKIIGGTIIGDPLKEITGINSLHKADNNQISYVTNQKYINKLVKTSAGAVIINSSIKR